MNDQEYLDFVRERVKNTNYHVLENFENLEVLAQMIEIARKDYRTKNRETLYRI